MAKEIRDRNFSEPKERTSNKHCRCCKEPVPKISIHFSNQVAIENHFCSWMCMLARLGQEKAYAILQEKTKENQEARKQHL